MGNNRGGFLMSSRVASTAKSVIFDVELCVTKIVDKQKSHPTHPEKIAPTSSKHTHKLCPQHNNQPFIYPRLKTAESKKQSKQIANSRPRGRRRRRKYWEENKTKKWALTWDRWETSSVSARTCCCSIAAAAAPCKLQKLVNSAEPPNLLLSNLVLVGLDLLLPDLVELLSLPT
jgi:hypothetical protein